MKKCLVAVIALVVTSGGAWAQDAGPDPWGAAEVDAYVEANRPRASTEVADPFAIPPAEPAPAGHLLLRSPVHMAGSDSDASAGFQYSATWKYDPTTQTMELTTFRPSGGTLLNLDLQGQTLPGMRSYSANIAGIDTYTDRQREDAGEGQNAYGARVQLSRVTIRNRGVGELRGSIIDDAGPPLPRGEYSYVHKWMIAPEDARALSQNIELQIAATPKSWSPGKWIICGTSYSGATVQRPTILTTSGCYLTATIDAFRFVDTRDGSVIREWTRITRR